MVRRESLIDEATFQSGKLAVLLKKACASVKSLTHAASVSRICSDSFADEEINFRFAFDEICAEVAAKEKLKKSKK